MNNEGFKQIIPKKGKGSSRNGIYMNSNGIIFCDDVVNKHDLKNYIYVTTFFNKEKKLIKFIFHLDSESNCQLIYKYTNTKVSITNGTINHYIQNELKIDNFSFKYHEDSKDNEIIASIGEIKNV